ncbi:MAG: DNA-3-methyladenine glycosylase I [Phycisphaerales bacterium]|nr:DNA-3-methyladenine glycosylase I [Phycisphaerales bacterium]
MPKGLIADSRGVTRCFWCMSDPLYITYHDREWGFPLTDDRRLFEKICLEGFQAGLSWLTILRKRENFRAAFADFNIEKIARFTKRDVARLLRDPGIVRHQGKIESTINNARRAIDLIDERGSLTTYAWQFEPPHQDQPRTLTWKTIAANPTNPQSIALSKDLRKRGFTFVGPTTMLAFMQAVGLVNHHITGCFAREAALSARHRLKLPLPLS